MLPNLIIIGAAKCATTSLHYYLGLHPQIFMSNEKELQFFVRECNWECGLSWYKSNFTVKVEIRGESSARYTGYPIHDGVPERMYSIIPEAKLIYIVRDPINRIISQYMHNYAIGNENRNISESLADINDYNFYICRSKYHMQLKQYLEYYHKSNILIVTQEELYNHRRDTLQKIFRFLDVDSSFYSRRLFNVRHKTIDKRRKNSVGMLLSSIPMMNIVNKLPADIRWHIDRLIYFPFSRRIERPVLPERLRCELVEYLKDDINCLREYTGYNFEEWCV